MYKSVRKILGRLVVEIGSWAYKSLSRPPDQCPPVDFRIIYAIWAAEAPSIPVGLIVGGHLPANTTRVLAVWFWAGLHGNHQARWVVHERTSIQDIPDWDWDYLPQFLASLDRI